MKECHLKVQLPGTFFQRKQRWWWRVRLPGETRVKSRALRPDGDQCGTKSRETAQKRAFELWQQALVTEAEARLRQEIRQQGQEKAKAYAELVGRLSTRAGRLVVRQAEKPKKPKSIQTPRSRKKSAQTVRKRRKPKNQLAQSRARPMLVPSGMGLDTSIVKTARCDCCATPFIPEVELAQIESGQNLCSKCMYYLRDAGKRQKRPQPEPSLV